MYSTLVRSVAPAADYIGGKRNLATRLVRIIDAHACDASGDVATFFGVLKER